MVTILSVRSFKYGSMSLRALGVCMKHQSIPNVGNSQYQTLHSMTYFNTTEPKINYLYNNNSFTLHTRPHLLGSFFLMDSAYFTEKLYIIRGKTWPQYSDVKCSAVCSAEGIIF